MVLRGARGERVKEERLRFEARAEARFEARAEVAGWNASFAKEGPKSGQLVATPQNRNTG